MQKKNLVLGTAIGYGPTAVSMFVKSFRAYNPDDDLILVVDSSLDIQTAQFYKSHAVKFIVFEAYKFIPTHMQNSRYIKYLEFLLENGTDYNHIFLADVKDVVFQGNIFENLPEQFLYFFSEDKNDTIKTNPKNARWIERNYGLEVLDGIGDRRIYCSGTTLGDYGSILKYLFYLVAQRNLDSFVTLGGEPDDQGPHNYLYYYSDLDAVGKISGDIVGTVGVTFSKSPGSVTFYNDGFYVDSLYPKVLHQFDRNIEIYAFFWNKYGC